MSSVNQRCNVSCKCAHSLIIFKEKLALYLKYLYVNLTSLLQSQNPLFHGHRCDTLVLENIFKIKTCVLLKHSPAWLVFFEFGITNPIRGRARKAEYISSPHIRWAAIYQILVSLPRNKTKAHCALPHALCP